MHVSPSQPQPVKWDENRVLKEAMPLLRKKQEELGLCQNYLQSIQEYNLENTGYSKLTEKKIRTLSSSDETMNEIKPIKDAVDQLVNKLSAKDLSTDRAKQLIQIASAYNLGWNYFKNLSDKKYSETFLSQTLKDRLQLVGKFTTLPTASIAAVTGVVFSVNSLLTSNYELPFYAKLPLMISTAVFASSVTPVLLDDLARYIKQWKLDQLRGAFQKAVAV